MTDFSYTDLLPRESGGSETPYRLVTTEGINVVDAGGRSFVSIEPEVLRLLTYEAFHDISHLLRPDHLAQLASILDDPEASPNDRFVALDLLKNANISAGGVLPMCQDTGTAIVMGKRGQTSGPPVKTRSTSVAASSTRTETSTCGTHNYHR